MKLVMDERLKHRLVGLAVIISLVAIFVPAIIKKSTHRFDGKILSTVTLPQKPSLPEVALPKKQILFKRIKVAHVNIPSVGQQPISTQVRAEPLSQPHERTQPVALAVHREAEPAAHHTTLARSEVPAVRVPEIGPAAVKPIKSLSTVAVSKPTVKPKVSVVTKPVALKTTARNVKKTSLAKGAYSVQLATFSQKSNAVLLINRLKGKGYKAWLNTVQGRDGMMVYKVLVGNEQQRQQAQALQKQLAVSLQITGFIVPSTGVS